MKDTIVAKATPSGQSGVGIIRVSGPLVTHIAKKILPKIPDPKIALHTSFLDESGFPLDYGIALFFKAPHSFTGEDVLELQGHGSPIILTEIIQQTIQLGARLAKPGEFSERAFLNGKIDLTQAEAIADLIGSHSMSAAKSAIRSLQGNFSTKINELVTNLIRLRTYVEAAIDFPEEEIDFLADQKILTSLIDLQQQLKKILATATQGVLLRDGIRIAILGQPNVGKSSLLNYFTGRDSAIVTDIPGTTRDIIQEYIDLDGLMVHILDTAGLRETIDVVEQEGVRRAQKAALDADLILWLMDVSSEEFDPLKNTQANLAYQTLNLSEQKPVILIYNKIDLAPLKFSASHDSVIPIIGLAPGFCSQDNNLDRRIQQNQEHCYISIKTGQGLKELRQKIKSAVGFNATEEDVFIARSRHLDALKRADHFLRQAVVQLTDYHAGELLAEDLRQAQQVLSEITGVFTNDNLLTEIFSSFCIGK